MKRIAAWLILAVLCMLGTSALADGMVLADKTRIDPGLPEGMKYHSLTWSGDVLNIVIDTDATDWDVVATAARKSGSLVIHPGIYHPEIDDPQLDGINKEWLKNQLGEVRSSDYYRNGNETSWAQSEQRVYDLLNQGLQEKPDYGKNGKTYSCSYQGWAIGNYDESTGLFLPREISARDGAGFAVCWRMLDNTLLSECVRFTVSYTKMPPIYVRRQGTAAKDIQGNAGKDNNDPLASNLISSTDIQEGRIVYRLANGAADKKIYTAVAVPSWINGSNMKAYQLANGKEIELDIYDRGTHFSDRSSVVLDYELRAQNCLYKADWAIKWVWEDAKGNKEKSVLYLEAEFHVGNPNFTVTYPIGDEEGAEALPASRLSWEINNPLDGLSVSVSDGIFHMVIDEDSLPPNRKTDLSQTTVSARVTPPKDAASCAVYMYRGDVIYGNNGEKAWKINELKVIRGEPVIVPDLTQRLFFDEVTVVLHNGKYMSYYVAPLMVGEYGGETLVFEWLDSDGQRIGNRQYLALTSDAYKLAIQRNPSETKNPKKADKFPTVLMERQVSVETAELPQKGENVVRYDITLLDENGNKLQPQQGETVLLYLPYPDDMSIEEASDYMFVVYHEFADGSYEEFSIQNGRLKCTPYGLCMEVTSFSPYYLNWEVVPDLPATGDSASLVPYALMLAACFVCASALAKRRMRENA